MKGLFVSDLLWLKHQKRFLLSLPGLLGLYLVLDIQISLIMLYLTIILQGGLLQLVLQSLQPETARFLFALPVSRGQFVREKYALILGLCGLGMLTAGGLCVLFRPHHAADLPEALGIGVIWLLFFTALLIPMAIRFDTGVRIWMVVLLMFAAAILSYVMGEATLPDTFFWEWMQNHRMTVFLPLAVLCSAGCAVSAFISKRMLESREY
ncbi:ABC-2 transporter permease [Faecalibaculum rodentium]|uniref:ABC-2 transporter permease n=1 Tax=Faecalibaculum rodentium TaxID=1702221 RepID=UPI0023F22363|nr:ABC-2 transporter permease [Faecalibaculum rodentium]